MNTSRNNDRWDSLSMKEKSDMMKVAVQQGIYNLSDIRKAYNEYAEGGPKNQPYTPFLNETPMQAAMRQIQSPEARAAYWNATHPQTTNETPIVAQSDGTFRRETRNIPLNTSAEAAKTALEFTPLVGDVLYAGDVADEARQGNYGTAATMAGLALGIPFVGNKIGKVAGKFIRKFKNKGYEGFASLNDDINPKLPGALKAAKASQKAKKDIAEMNKYHAANVEEYNVATNSNIKSKPFREDVSNSRTVVLPNDEFDAKMKELYTNSPSNNVSNIGGLYNWKDDTTYLRQTGKPSNAYHEFLHRGDYGVTNREVTKWRIDQLVDPSKIEHLNPNERAYYLSEAEFPVHLRQQGENLGINVGDPFPGEEVFDNMISNNGIGGAATYTKGMNVEASLADKMLAWKALNGTLFGAVPMTILGGTAASSYANQQGLGGPLVDRANQYALGGNMYGWGDFLKGSYNSIKDTASNVVDKAGDALISAANWLHDALKVDSPTPAATTKPYVEQDYTSPAFMPYSYGSTSNYNVDDSSWDETKEVQLPEITITTDKVLKELPVEKLSQNEYLRNEYNKDNSVEEARKLNREDLKKLQQTLADKGYYDLNTDNMSVDEIKNIQKKIGAKVDGIAGKETREKWRQYNVDGLWGKRTEEAILKGTKRDYWDRDVTTDNTEWCAEWVHKKAVNATGNDNCGVWGDAWRMPQNVVKNGGTEVYNIYNDKAFRGITDVTSLKKATEKALKEHPFDISTLRVGDIVGIYMPSSNMHSTALRDGTTFNTHVGVVTGFDKNGKPVIEHNIHKNHHKDAADNIRGSLVGKARIATVSRPDYGTPQKAFEVESAPSKYTKESDSPLFKQYAESAAGSKELLQNVFPNVDIDEVERIALAVQGRETGFMKNKRSDQTGISGLKVKAGDYYRDNIMGKNAESVSSNLAKMKLTSFDPNERYMLGLTDPKDLEDPKKAGTAAMYLMAKNYSYFKNLQESYPQLGITDDDIRYLTELSYNQGMSKLRNIGFTSEGAAAPEELEAIRAMADENAKIKDVSATNYRYLGSLGKMLYDAFADGHTPYIAAAEKYRRQLMENADTE